MQQSPGRAARAPGPGPSTLLEGRGASPDLGWGTCQRQHHPRPESFNPAGSILKRSPEEFWPLTNCPLPSRDLLARL